MLKHFIILNTNYSDIIRIKKDLSHKYGNDVSVVSIDASYDSFSRFLASVINEANRDGLTGVYNKRCLMKFLDKLSKLEQDNSLCMIDIDNFRDINTKYGHVEADKILCNLVRVFKKCVRKTDMIFRFGGDEFVIIFKGILKEQAYHVFSRVLKELKTKKYLPLSVTYGFADLTLGNDPRSALKLADDRMMVHKHAKSKQIH